jgi:hypothetical protein
LHKVSVILIYVFGFGEHGLDLGFLRGKDTIKEVAQGVVLPRLVKILCLGPFRRKAEELFSSFATFPLELSLSHRRFPMTSLKPHGWAVALLALLSASSLLGQINPKIPRPRTARGQPCWQQVGIPRSAIERRKQIEQNTRSQVQAVCNDSALSPEQKREKIRKLHEQAHQEVEAVINPQQQQELKACQQERAAARGEGGRGHSGGGVHRGGGNGPCGEMPSDKETPTRED